MSRRPLPYAFVKTASLGEQQQILIGDSEQGRTQKASQSDLVPRIYEHRKQQNQIPYLTGLIERHAAKHDRRNAVIVKRSLQLPKRHIRARQDGDIAVLEAPNQLAYPTGDPQRLEAFGRFCVFSREHEDVGGGLLLSREVIPTAGEFMLFNSWSWPRERMIHDLQKLRPAAIVRAQFIYRFAFSFQFRSISRKQFRLRMTKSKDGLVDIAYSKERIGPADQAEQLPLQWIRVLQLIHEDVIES